MAEMKTCPFCDMLPNTYIAVGTSSVKFAVFCPSCGCEQHTESDNCDNYFHVFRAKMEEAESLWNTRVREP